MGRALFRAFVVVVLAAGVAFGLLATLRVSPEPSVSLTPGGSAIGRKTAVEVAVQGGGRGLAGLKLELILEDRSHVLAERTYTPRRPWEFWGPRTTEDALRVDVGSETVAGLRSGEATLRATASRAGTWLRQPDPAVNERTLPVRLTPPTLHLLSTQHYVAQGGAEVVVYRTGDTAVQDGVRAGGEWFPGFALPGGGERDRFALFAVPHDLDDHAHVRLVAADDAGNEAAVAFVDQFFKKPFKTDTLSVDDAFMGKVVPEILAQTPELKDRGSLLENYLAINRDLRKANGETLEKLAARSAPRFLWTEAFLHMPGGQVMAAFADRRTYLYGGREVDRQDHLGFDLATTRKSPIPAANRGVVVLARYFGIFGNAVVIDHGYGLMSLYGHLSSIDVEEGQEVDRGAPIGRTGDTGLAGGDHLHFTMLVHGVAANPAEWWDAHWIRDRLSRKLGAVLPFETPAAAGT